MAVLVPFVFCLGSSCGDDVSAGAGVLAVITRWSDGLASAVLAS